MLLPPAEASGPVVSAGLCIFAGRCRPERLTICGREPVMPRVARPWQIRHVRSLHCGRHRRSSGFPFDSRGSPISAVLRCRSPCKAAFYVDGACATIAPNSKRSCYSPLAERRGQSFPLASCTLMQDRNISSPARGAPCMFSGPFRRACAQADSAADCPSCPSRGRLLFGPSRSRFHATLWCKRVVRAFQQFSEIPSARRRTVAP